MLSSILERRAFMAELFTGRSPRHGVAFDCPWPKCVGGYDRTYDRPVADFVPQCEQFYADKLRYTEAIGDDSVPFVPLWSHTGIFAEAFGCAIHHYDHEQNPCARPKVFNAADAAKLPQPRVTDGRGLANFFELCRELRRRLGPEVPFTVPDIQSPFDIAALVWEKEDFLLALLDEPEIVKGLVEKCRVLLTDFFRAFRDEFGPEIAYNHCPASVWAPPALGVWLSEDEVGAISTGMFEEFCLAPLTRLSEDFGGLFMHCCASADHQYRNFNKIPNLRGLNRVYQAAGPGPAIAAFSGQTVLIHAWLLPEDVKRHIAMARPDTRFFFDLPGLTLDEARRAMDELRPLLTVQNP